MIIQDGLFKLTLRFIKNSYLIRLPYFSKKYFTPFKIRLIKLIYKRIDNRNPMINVGGGSFYKKHWRVLDFRSSHYRHATYYIDYSFDLTCAKPLPFKDNLVKFFYCSHTLEHIPQEYCQHIFNEFFRCLRKGGAVRLTMPDFDKAYKAYGKKNENFFIKSGGENLDEKFLDFFASYFAKKISKEELKKNYEIMKKNEFADYYTSKIPRESQKKAAGNHINWWNFSKLKNMLQIAGFKKIYASQPQKSHFPEMRGWGQSYGFDTTNPELSVFVEAVK